MFLGPMDRLGFRDTISDMALSSRRVTLLIPVITNSGFDSDTQTGNSITSGDGTGRTVSWKIQEMYGFLKPITQALITYGQVPPGVEVGDVVFTSRLQDKEVVMEAYGNQYAYLYIDGETYRVVTTVYEGVGQNEGVVVGCKHYTPSVFRCAGY